jgi:hypothetical protein
MDDKITYKLQYWMAWCGPFMVVTYLYFWIILGHNFPPPSATLTGAELVSQYYGKYQSDILLGQSLCAASGLLYLPWCCLLTVQMWRREKVPVLSLMQLTGGLLTAWVLVLCPAMWAWCAKYATTPGVQPELVKGIHMLSWYIYDMTYMITTIQLFGCGLFAILDKKTPKIIPAWAGWYALAVGVGFIPLSFLPYHEDGPFSVGGWWSFHIVFGSWGVWFSTYTYYMFQELKRIRISPAPAIGVAIGQGAAR